MIIPNKVISLDESALGRVGIILSAGPHERGMADLFETVGDKFESIDQFLLTLDVLYVLGKIDIDRIEGTITYAD